jgi:hypothetical protein
VRHPPLRAQISVHIPQELMLLKAKSNFSFGFLFRGPRCPDPIAYNVYVYAVRGIGGLKNEAQWNVNPDLLRIAPRSELHFET